VLPHFLSSTGGGTGSTQPRELQLRSYLVETVAAPVKKGEIMAVVICRADNATPLNLQKLALASPTSGGRSVGIVRSWTKATKLLLFVEH
jgi:hypothetical protein